jgi:hypothetical protein
MSTNSILATTPLVSTNYLLRATGTTIGNSLIWDNGTNVGIGNQGTTYNLDVTGSLRNTTSAYLATGGGNVGIGTTTITNSAGYAKVLDLYDATSSAAFGLSIPSYNYQFGLESDGGLRIRYNGSARLTIASTGAATFSSSVSGSSFTANGSTSGGYTGLTVANASTGSAGLLLNNSAQAWLLNTRTDNQFSIYNGTAGTTPFLISTSGAATFTSSSTNPITLYSTTTSGEGLKMQWQTAYGTSIIVADIRGNASGAGGAFIIRTADTSAVLQERLVINNLGQVTTNSLFSPTRYSINGAQGSYGVKIISAGGVTSYSVDLTAAFPEATNLIAGNVWGVYGKVCIFRGGTAETAAFALCRNSGSAWSSGAFSLQTCTGTYSLSGVSGSGNSITFSFNTTVYFICELSVLVD